MTTARRTPDANPGLPNFPIPGDKHLRSNSKQSWTNHSQPQDGSGQDREEAPGLSRKETCYGNPTDLLRLITFSLEQLRTTLALKNIFGYTLNDYRQDFWLEELSYEVHYNQQGILSIAYSQSGTGAYPDQQTRHFVVDLETGRTIKPSEVFISNQSEKLATLLDSKLQAEIRQILSETGDEGRSVYEGKNLRFEVKDLENFAVGPNGITFLYDAGFPHVIQALEPDGQYLLSFVELKPYLRLEGQLGQFVR